MDDKIASRFWTKVKKIDDGCWEWTGATTFGGYGTLRIERHNVGAHRIAYELAHGSIPDGLLVCHKCDNPCCVNPDHLFLGTFEDNLKDKIEKGRHKISHGRFARSKQKRDAKSDEERFWEKVDKSGECWKWTAATTKFGHGICFVKGEQVSAHRISYEWAYGPIPDGLSVLHHCDNPACINPEHLFLGTQTDNMRDMRDKGRSGVWTKPDKLARGEKHWQHTKPERAARGDRHGTHTHPERVLRGEEHGCSKLTWALVRMIRELFRNRKTSATATTMELAQQFSVSKTTITNVVYNHSWKEDNEE